MRNEEAALGASRNLRHGYNIGKGQVAGADFFIVPDLANSNSGGNALGAVVGAFGSRLGGGWAPLLVASAPRNPKPRR